MSTISIDDHIQSIQDAVLHQDHLRPVGGNTKPALSDNGNLDVSNLKGVLEYNPQEYTFTALAGTPVKEVSALLAEHGQYLPFDPPFARAGATLGGTVAAGLSGPGRFRYGGVRDFLLGVKFVSGEGQLITGGGKVVKNAAGFDFPKLMVGSLGQFGVMVELTFKVFPRPEAYTSLRVDLPKLEDAVAMMQKLAMANLELSCLDFEPPNRLLIRIGGIAEVLSTRVEHLQAFIGLEGDVLEGEADEALWQQQREHAWIPEHHALVKIPLSPEKVGDLEAALARNEVQVPRCYSVGGNVAYIAWPDEADRANLHSLLLQLALSALAITGKWQTPLFGHYRGQAFMQRIVQVLDPQGKFSLSSLGVSDAA